MDEPESEECFYCGELTRPAELEALGGICKTCRELADIVRVKAARLAQQHPYTQGPNPQRIL